MAAQTNVGGNDRQQRARSEFEPLIGAMLAAWNRRDIEEFRARLELLRARARRNQFHVVVALLGAIESTVQRSTERGGGCAVLRWYFDRIDDALACDPADASACEAVLASVAVLRAG